MEHKKDRWEAMLIETMDAILEELKRLREAVEHLEDPKLKEDREWNEKNMKEVQKPKTVTTGDDEPKITTITK